MPSTRRNPRYIAILGISAITILVAGAIFRPRTPGPDETAAAGASTDITRLQRLTQRRSIDGFAEFFTELARQVDDRVLRLEGGGRTAIVWGLAEAVTAGGSPRLPNEDEARGADDSSNRWSTKTRTAGPHLPAAVLDLAAIEQGAPPPSPVDRFSARFYPAGAWAVAVWRDKDGGLQFRAGQLLGTETVLCDGTEVTALRLNLTLEDETAGAGIFDLDEGLLGVAASCDGRLVALDVEAVDEVLRDRDTLVDHLLRRYGLRLAELDPRARAAFGAEYGFAVSEVRQSYQAAEAGLMPGDVVTEIDGNPVTAERDLEPLTLPVAREVFDLGIIRRGRPRHIELRARGEVRRRYIPGGMRWSETTAGFEIGEVDREGPAFEAGLRSGDRLLAVNGAELKSRAAAERALGAERETGNYLTVRRGERIWGVFLN